MHKEITINYKIEGLFEYCMRNKIFQRHYKFNDKYDNHFEEQKAFFKEYGFKDITGKVKELLKSQDVKIKILDKKYNKNNYQKYIIINLTYSRDDYIYTNIHEVIKNTEYEINDLLFENRLYNLKEIY